MSEDAADIIFEGLAEEKRYPMMAICDVATEFHDRCNPEYIKKKMEVIVNELQKIWDNRT